mmetsp:Transcript_64825/g.144844  ORF Transcript_64825/g.144844 Transcript_64825/m.144844 type:complete len:255 (-) Transcript_64825:199-963(-)
MLSLIVSAARCAVRRNCRHGDIDCSTAERRGHYKSTSSRRPMEPTATPPLSRGIVRATARCGPPSPSSILLGHGRCRWLHRMVARAATSVSSWALGAVGSACTITRMPGTHFSSDGSCGLFHPRRGLVSTGMSSLPHLSRIAGGSLKPRRALPGRRRRRALNASTVSSARMTCSLSLLAGPIPPSTLERASVSPISSSTSIRLATARTRCSTLRLASARFRQQRGLPRHLTMTGMGIRSGRHLCTCTLFGLHSL